MRPELRPDNCSPSWRTSTLYCNAADITLGSAGDTHVCSIYDVRHINASSDCADESARVLSRQLVQAWLASNHAGYLQNGRVMSEKYNAMAAGKAGGGGEYSVQIGFGWTNGVMLHFLQEYGWSPSQQLPDAYLRNIKTLSLPWHGTSSAALIPTKAISFFILTAVVSTRESAELYGVVRRGVLISTPCVSLERVQIKPVIECRPNSSKALRLMLKAMSKFSWSETCKLLPSCFMFLLVFLAFLSTVFASMQAELIGALYGLLECHINLHLVQEHS